MKPLRRLRRNPILVPEQSMGQELLRHNYQPSPSQSIARPSILLGRCVLFISLRERPVALGSRTFFTPASRWPTCSLNVRHVLSAAKRCQGGYDRPQGQRASSSAPGCQTLTPSSSEQQTRSGAFSGGGSVRVGHQLCMVYNDRRLVPHEPSASLVDGTTQSAPIF